ncbi:hypothetical protein NM688_g145 [Phlebia brevispora]|uniref:Uncharacterized protein n=1 Tax=Phlebia brevispora TaxID=194682 RepID=A0ACC1TFX9_9APHY|nr:hypothetical protein NM688_g145 [Phlebia brevispora]
MTEQSLPKLAFLGPVGTYSHQVGGAYDRFGGNVDYVEKQKIKDVFDAISAEIPFGLVPQENSIYGSVTETYDALREPEVGETKFVKGEVTLAVQHCLVVRQGVKAEDVTRILSHEQALGQCGKYLQKNFPSAALQKMASTAAAAQALLNEGPEQLHSAAICSPLCAVVFKGLEILQESIQDKNTNCTRFYVLAQGLETKPPYLPGPPQLQRALVRIGLPAPEEPESAEDGSAEALTTSISAHNRPLHMVMSTLLTTFGVPVIRIDRRPSLNHVPFEHVYYVELEELGSELGVENSADDEHGSSVWLNRVQMGVDRVCEAGGEATIIGVW